MTHQEWLLQRAATYWENDESLPLALFVEMNEAGIDVDAEEKLHYLMSQYD